MLSDWQSNNPIYGRTVKVDPLLRFGQGPRAHRWILCREPRGGGQNRDWQFVAWKKAAKALTIGSNGRQRDDVAIQQAEGRRPHTHTPERFWRWFRGPTPVRPAYSA
jgi:hypothetical protein